MPKSGEHNEIKATAKNIAHMGRVRNTDGLPSLIIKEPLKLASAMLPKIIPITIEDMENSILLRKYPKNPNPTITKTSVIELL